MPNPIDAKLTYRHHIHGLTSASEYIENEDPSTKSVTSLYADSYQSPTNGGCFTIPYYHIASYWDGTYYESHHDVYWPSPSPNPNAPGHNWCYINHNGEEHTAGPDAAGKFAFHCRHQEKNIRGNKWTTTPTTEEMQHCDKTLYLRSCNLQAGIVTDVHFEY